jgi:hypothetical protein
MAVRAGSVGCYVRSCRSDIDESERDRLPSDSMYLVLVVSVPYGYILAISLPSDGRRCWTP